VGDSDIGNCFICGEKAQYAHFYDISVGHFVSGGEPRTCAACSDKLHEMTDEQRRKLFEIFETLPEAPNESGDLLGDTLARSEEFKNRGRA
jgi:hypothetical protein